jgi:uncharacterized protein DUF1996
MAGRQTASRLKLGMTAAMLASALLAGGAGEAQGEAVPVDPGQGFWSVGCPFTVRAPNDPIVSFGRPGASHMHDFFGNPKVTAFSTRRRLLRAPAKCTRGGDHSGYWAPTLARGASRDEAGEPSGIVPSHASIYYLAAMRDPATIRPFPTGLRMIAGDGRATSGQDREVVAWFCGEGGRPQPEPPLCVGSPLHARILFPDCTDGRRDSADHRSHMAYSEHQPGAEFRTCPQGHPVSVPQVRLTIAYPANAGFFSELSSGGRFSMHADFFEAWEGRSIERLVRGCINENRNCGHLGPVGPDES